MKNAVHEAAADTLDVLISLTNDGVRPREARVRLGELRKRYPETPIELVWEEAAYDATVHYDALLQLPGSGTVSVSFSPERGLPWPLRGVHRWSDADLVRVKST